MQSSFSATIREAAVHKMVGLGIAIVIVSMNPIVIDDCRIVNARSYVSADRPLVLAFTNRRATPADEIHFTVRYAGRTEHIVDRGVFSQNVRIDHAFPGFYNARYWAAPPSCSVDYVEFRDGSVWTATTSAPDQRAGPPRGLRDEGSEWMVHSDHPFGGWQAAQRAVF
jgi:hypothetical protein